MASALTVVLVTGQVVRAQSAPPVAATVAEKSPAEIARLIAELDHDEYRVRQDATRKLARGGVEAVGPLAKAAMGENLESAFRALAALKELGCADDEATEEAAFAAIESLATGESKTAERAQSVMAAMRVASQARAKARLIELGATIVDNGSGDDFGGPVFIGGGGAIMAGRVVFLGGGAGSGYYVGGTTVEISEKWTGKADDLRLLRRIDKIGQIIFAGDQVTDAWLAPLSGMPAGTLQRIEFRRTKVTDAGMANIAGFSALAAVDIMHTPITDAAVETLSKLTNAQMIRLYGTKVSAAGANKLATALPNARIDRRGGALLGVGGSIGERPCIINRVEPDSAAAKAGIVENDVIVSFDGNAVQDFAELTAAISEKVGGEKVVLEILRPSGVDTPGANATPQSVTVTLGSW